MSVPFLFYKSVLPISFIGHMDLFSLSGHWTGSKKSHTKAQCVTCFGLIPTIVVVGEFHLGELATRLAKTFLRLLTIRMV